MIQTVFLLGNHIQALGLARQICRTGISVILFSDTKYSISRFSNAVKKWFVFKNEDELLTKIIELNKNPKNILLFPTNDKMVEFLCQNYSILNKLFYLGIPDPITIDIFANKCNTYHFASNHNIPVPESYFPRSFKELEKLSEIIEYPVIIKPAVMYRFHEMFGSKAFKCNNKAELISKVITITRRFPWDQLFIQEFLEGGAKTLFSYGTFAVNGNTIVSLMANRTRQNPMTFGNSTTYAVTCNNPIIKEQAETLLRLTKYFGLAEVEFMYDEKTGKYKFLEVNTRAWKWHSISDGLGFSFIGKMISYFNNNDTSEIKDFNTQIGWVERLTDTVVVVKELLKGNNLIREVIKSYNTPRVYAVWSRRDIIPFFMYMVLSPILFFKRH